MGYPHVASIHLLSLTTNGLIVESYGVVCLVRKLSYIAPLYRVKRSRVNQSVAKLFDSPRLAGYVPEHIEKPAKTEVLAGIHQLLQSLAWMTYVLIPRNDIIQVSIHSSSDAQTQYYNQVLFDAQFSTATWSGANEKKKKKNEFSPPHASKAHASPYAGMSSTVLLRRKLA